MRCSHAVATSVDGVSDTAKSPARAPSPFIIQGTIHSQLLARPAIALLVLLAAVVAQQLHTSAARSSRRRLRRRVLRLFLNAFRAVDVRMPPASFSSHLWFCFAFCCIGSGGGRDDMSTSSGQGKNSLWRGMNASRVAAMRPNNMESRPERISSAAFCFSLSSFSSTRNAWERRLKARANAHNDVIRVLCVCVYVCVCVSASTLVVAAAAGEYSLCSGATCSCRLYHWQH